MLSAGVTKQQTHHLNIPVLENPPISASEMLASCTEDAQAPGNHLQQLGPGAAIGSRTELAPCKPLSSRGVAGSGS